MRVGRTQLATIASWNEAAGSSSGRHPLKHGPKNSPRVRFPRLVALLVLRLLGSHRPTSGPMFVRCRSAPEGELQTGGGGHTEQVSSTKRSGDVVRWSVVWLARGSETSGHAVLKAAAILVVYVHFCWQRFGSACYLTGLLLSRSTPSDRGLNYTPLSLVSLLFLKISW